MSWPEWEWLRYVNAITGLLALAFYCFHITALWDKVPPRIKVRRLAIALLIAGIAYGSVEAHLQGAEFGLRVLIWMVGLSLLLGSYVGDPERDSP